MNDKRRVVITGIGVLSSLGSDIETFWTNVSNGKSGIGPLALFDGKDYPCRVSSEVRDFNPESYMEAKDAKRMDRFVQFAMAGAQLAMKDGNLNPAEVDPEFFSVIIGAGIGGMKSIREHSAVLFERGPRRVSPFMIPSIISNMAGGMVAIKLGANGPNFAPVSACASGCHAIGTAYEQILLGNANVCLAGGSEAAIDPLSWSGFCSMKAMSFGFNDNPSQSSRPFDQKRDGFVMGEGCGILILESLEHALARKAKIYCEISGYAATCDAYHITSPDPESKGLSLCFNRVLKSANLQPEDVQYINAHGTSTEYNDKTETLAIKKVFKEHARKLKISSTKSMTGHLLGAAGGIEAAVAIKSIETGIIPPTINYEYPDPECDLDYTPNTKVSCDVNVAISNNMGFGGQNAALLFKKFV